MAGWRRRYRQRILAGKEYCRNCLVVAFDLTFDHILPKSKGGHLTLENTTILCTRCQHLKGDRLWPDQVSLAQEESTVGVLVDVVVVKPRKRRPPRRRKPRPEPRKLCEPSCICSSCTFWRAKRIVS